MNKTLQTLLCLCAAAVVFGSCQKEEEKTVTTLNISIADSYTPNETNAKVVLDGITPKFEEGDQIWISGYPYTVNSDGTTVTGSGAETPYYAVFPYDEDMGEISGAFPTITLPTEQPYVSLENDEHGNPIQKINAPMWAYAAAGEVGGLSFHNACALLRVRVRNNIGMGVFTLKSITVTSSTNDIAGTGTLAYNEETGEYDLTVSGSKTVTLTGLNEAVKENKSSQEYYIYIPSVADETFTIIANGTYQGTISTVFSQVSNSSVSVEKSTIGVVSHLLNKCTYKMTGQFSVAANRAVYFSPGNLQYQPSTKIWRFAESQEVVYLGTTNGGNTLSQNNVPSTSKWIDLFGWGTSGYENGNTYYKPYDRLYVNDGRYGFGYGPTDGSSYNYPLTGDKVNSDWGVYNAIQNGNKTDPAGTWRTMTNTEWVYLFSQRNNWSSRCIPATVNSVSGMIFLPDQWIIPNGISITPTVIYNKNKYDYDMTTNEYTSAQWQKLEQHGAIFLPFSGYSSGAPPNVTTAVSISNNAGSYWSSDNSGNSNAYVFKFFSTNCSTNVSQNRHLRGAVRLVRDVE